MSSSLKDLQCIAVRIDEDRSETTAVVPLTHRVERLQSCHIFQSIDEPCLQSCARGRPRLSYREEHRNAPVKLTAAQSGPWHRPANYRPSRLDSATHVEYPDRDIPRKPRENKRIKAKLRRQPLNTKKVKPARKAEQKDGCYGHQAIRLS